MFQASEAELATTAPADPITDELNDLADKALEHYESAQRAVRAEIARLRELDRTYEGKIAALRSLLKPDSEPPPSGAPLRPDNGQLPLELGDALAQELRSTVSHDRKSKEAIWSAAAVALRLAGPLHYLELSNVLDAYVELGGRNRAATLLAYLGKRPDIFKRVSRGTYSVTDEADRVTILNPPPRQIAVHKRRKRRRTRVRRKKS